MPNLPWTRPYFERSGRKARDFRVIWLEAPIGEPRFHPLRHGFPSGSLVDLKLTAIDDADWLRRWTEGPWGYQLEQVAGIDALKLRDCRHGIVVQSELEDPSDLSHVQIGAAVCKAFADQGALAALDVIGDRWWSTPALLRLRPDRPFEIEEHITTTAESNERSPGSGHLCHTRGLRKFARPEVFLRGLRPSDFRGAGKLLNDLGDRLASGNDYGGSHVVVLHPTDDTTLPPLTFREHADDSSELAPDPHGLGRQMFNSPSLEVVDLDEMAQGPATGCPRILNALRKLEKTNEGPPAAT